MPQRFFSKRRKPDDLGFCVKVSIASATGYLTGSLIALIVDPKLTGHVRYHARPYPDYAYWLVPVLGLVVLVGTFVWLYSVAREKRIWIATLPAWIFSLPTFWMLRPELPHAGFLGSMGYFSFLSTVAIRIRYCKIEDKYLHHPTLPFAAKLERARQEIGFWKTGLLAVIGGYLALIVSWCISVLGYSSATTPKPDEQFLLNVAELIFVGVVSAWIWVGVIAEIFRKSREALTLLERIPGDGPISGGERSNPGA